MAIPLDSDAYASGLRGTLGHSSNERGPVSFWRLTANDDASDDRADREQHQQFEQGLEEAHDDLR